MLKTVVLAAGKGERLKSKTPKVLHKVFDKPVLYWVLDSLAEVPQDEIIVVCGYKKAEVESFLHAYPVSTVHQKEQLGTGHALRCVLEEMDDFDGNLLVLNGDCPLIKPETLNSLIDLHESTGSKLSLLTCKVEKPKGYGRIVKKKGKVVGIKEEKDCTESEKTIDEINAGVYCIDLKAIKPALDKLSNNNAQEEYYLTDIVEWAYSQGFEINSFEAENPREVLGVNTRSDLAKVVKEINQETLENLMVNGVTIVDPGSTIISADVDIAPDTIIHPGTYIHRRTIIGKNCEIGPNTSIFGPAEIGDNTTIISSHIFRSSIGNNCQIGPFAHVRDGNDVADNVRIGNFVELKNCEVGNDVSAAHLSYLGDSKIKSNVNIGAGTITANFDSRNGEKNQTVIKTGASTGANSVLVAPLEVGENSLVAAGSVVTEDVPADKLFISRAPAEVKDLKKLTPNV